MKHFVTPMIFKQNWQLGTIDFIFIIFKHWHPKGMDLKYKYIEYHFTHFQLTKCCTCIINQQSWAILIFRWSSSVLRMSELASKNIIQWEEWGTMSLDDSVNAIALFELFCHVESLQFSLS